MKTFFSVTNLLFTLLVELSITYLTKAQKFIFFAISVLGPHESFY